MDLKARPPKRQRLEIEEKSGGDGDKHDLSTLLRLRRWKDARELAINNPDEVKSCPDPSPLALACRYGAPYECIKSILQACPSKLRRLLDSRGTPLHEAIVYEDSGPEVIGLLLRTDEELGTESRVCVLQDVDGYCPLHLLIRRRFQSHVLGSNEGSHLMELLEMLVKSCAKAVVIPDRGEYEEPPIVMALKANVYAPLLATEDGTVARVERNIFEMVNCILKYYPSAASCVFNGYRGKYTALHSAVFHGRCPDTIELLLETEKRYPSSQKGGLLANTQGELPLHFCAMRGEPPRSVALLASAAPEAVTKRDASGLTPVHWLWIRFVSTLLAIEDGGRGSSITPPISASLQNTGSNKYSEFAALEQGDFEADLHFVRRVDPSVDFLRMRHIPGEVLDESDALQWAERTVAILKYIRQRYEMSKSASNNEYHEDEEKFNAWTRIEAVAGLFWAKIVSLLKATSSADEEFSLVHAAFKNHSSLPQVARIVASMYPQEMETPDIHGKLPLHHAASRPWHAWDWPREGTSDSANAQLLELESACLLRTAMSLSSIDAAKRKDGYGRLPIHYAVPTFVRAFSSSARSSTESPVTETLDLVRCFVQMNPDSLTEPDPDTGLYPFLQATAMTTEEASNCTSGSFPEEFSLSIVYLLLHENPSLVQSGIS
jgi:ankyrin repeat protein